MCVDPKNVAVHQGNADVVVCNKPVLLHWIVVSNHNSASKRAYIYNGESTSAPLELVIESSAKACFCVHTTVPIYLSSGLYLTVENSDLQVSIGYEIVT